MKKALQSITHSTSGNRWHAKASVARAERRSRPMTLVLFAAAAFATGGNANAYTFTDLDGRNGVGMDINNAGQVAGNADGKAVRWDGTSMTELGVLNPAHLFSCSATAINKAGQVAGQCNLPRPGNARHAVVWNGTTPTDLGSSISRHVDSIAYGINNGGKVVGGVSSGKHAGATRWNGTRLKTLGPGVAYDINGAGHVVGVNADHAFLWDGSTQIDLGTLGGAYRYSSAEAINNAGTVVGQSRLALAGGFRATRWDGTVATDLGTLWERGAGNSVAHDINNAGLIVGWSSTWSGVQSATLWKSTGPIDLNRRLDAATLSAGWHLTEAYGINDKLWITGSAYNTLTGEQHAFVLSVPEPQTYALMLAGLGALALAARRRRAAD